MAASGVSAFSGREAEPMPAERDRQRHKTMWHWRFRRMSLSFVGRAPRPAADAPVSLVWSPGIGGFS
jgi:hypothetical protein